MNNKFDSSFNLPKIDDAETGGATNTLRVYDCLEPLRVPLQNYHISAMWYASGDKFTVLIKYCDITDIDLSCDSVDYGLGDLNAASDLARFIDRVACMHTIKNKEEIIAKEHNLVDPVYTLPTLKSKGKVVFTDSTTGARVKFTFARADFEKLLNLAPPPRSSN